MQLHTQSKFKCMQVISLCANLKSVWYALLGQSCVKTGLWLFVVMLLPVVRARAGTNEKNRDILAWRGSLCYWARGLFCSTVTKTQQNKNRDESYNYKQKKLQSEIQFTCFYFK